MLKRLAIVVLFMIILFFFNAFLNPIPKREVVVSEKVAYGVSYSFEQARWYGLDERDAYIKLISDYDFDWVRVSFFWDQMVDSEGNLAIDDLRFAIEEADKKDIKVVVALGAKTPYYPEFHLPNDLSAQLKAGESIGLNSPISSAILGVTERLVRELSTYENISHWQIENEPFTPNVNGWTLEESLIGEEVKLVKKTDKLNRPIILSHVGPAVFDLRWKKLLRLLEPGDVLGINAYFKTQAPNLLGLNFLGKQLSIGWPQGFSWPVQSWGIFSPDFESIKNEAAKSGVSTWVLEMQAEPYIRTLKDARDRQFSFTALDIESGQNYLSSQKITSIGLWGAPFWLYRESIGDSSWIDTVAEIVN